MTDRDQEVEDATVRTLLTLELVRWLADVTDEIEEARAPRSILELRAQPKRGAE